MKFLVLVTITLALACGCGGQPTSLPTATAVYEAADGFAFVTAFRDDGAWVFLPEGTLQLQPVPAASGAKYHGGQVTLWIKGEEATLQREGQPDVILRNNPRRAVWEHAKLSGMDFRAVGNEPGWVLEIWGDGPIVFRGNYGQEVHEFPRTEPVTDQESRTSTFTCRQDDRKMMVVLQAGPCRDTMSDEEFETAVTVRLDGKEYRGCGRSLH